MKPIIFCNITYMQYYNGVAKDFDEPVNGGKWVNENNDATESHNFSVITFDDQKNYCLGYVQTKSGKITLENVYGCETAKNEEWIDGVIVVWCATPKEGQRRIVGWYKNATVNRYLQDVDITFEEHHQAEQVYNFWALKEDCILLPDSERQLKKWSVPNSHKNNHYFGYSYFGFGQANVWYGKITQNTKKALSKDELVLCQEKLNEYLETLIENIENYNGKNLLDDFD